MHLGWIAGQCFLALVVLVLALPGRRDHNDDDLPDEGDVDQQAAAEAPLPGSRRARRLAAEDPGTDAPAGDPAAEPAAFAAAAGFPEQPAPEQSAQAQPAQEQPVYAAYPGQQYQDPAAYQDPAYQDPGYAQGYPATGYPDPAYQDPAYQDPAYQAQPYPAYPEQPPLPPQPYYDEQGYPVQPQPYADPQYAQQPPAPHGYDWSGGAAPAAVPGQAGAPHDTETGAYGSLPPDDPWLQVQQPVRHPNDEAGS
jgi:hypothetical protein